MKVAVDPGVNAIACPACRELNKQLKTRSFEGTMFVPVTMRQIAALKADKVITASGVCHSHGHRRVLELRV